MHLTKPANPRLQTAIGRIRRIVRRSQLPGIIARIRALKPAAVAQTTDDTLSAHRGEPEARQTRLRAAVDRIGRAVQNKRLQRKKSELPKTIAAIKAAFLSDYRPSKPAYARFLTAATKLGLPVPALSVCGTGTREIRYTQLLAYYMNPKAIHGLGDRICRAVLGPEVAAFGVSDASWSQAEVVPEFDLGNVSFGKVQSGNQLDILIKLSECTVMIEHKIGSAEDASVADGTVTQLERYTKAAEENHPDFPRPLVKIFLTPAGTPPKDDDTWRTLSHRTVVQRLSAILVVPDVSTVARHNLATFIFDLITGPLAVDQNVWKAMIHRLQRLGENDAGYPSWRRWSRRNVPEFDTMLNVTEALYG